MLAVASCPPAHHVLLVTDGDLLALVAGETDRTPHIVRHGALETALAQQRIDGLNAVPTWKTIETILNSALITEN